MPLTRQMTVNDAGAPEEVQATIVCREIVIKEDPTAAGWPRKFQVRTPLATSAVNPVAEGGSWIFKKPGQHFQPGDVAGYVELLAAGGTTTFNVSEE